MGLGNKTISRAANLGLRVVFPERPVDIRMARYESGKRTPKADLTEQLAYYLDVSPKALDVPDLDTEIGLMHTLFALEDLRGIKVGKIDGEVCLRLDKDRGTKYLALFRMLNAWYEQAEKLKNEEITKEEYDNWRYNYPKLDTTGRWVKVPSQRTNEIFIK